MKRTVTIMFLSFYVLISLGLTINLHYCGGRLESLKLFGKTESCCCGGEVMDKSCCENHIIHYQISEEQRTSHDVRIQPVPVISLYLQDISSEFLGNHKIDDNTNLQLEIPPPKKQPVWLLNCTLTFYA